MLPNARAGAPPPARRVRKRKASSTLGCSALVPAPDNLLTRALAPMAADEVDEWEAWIELESEPAFFNAILSDWGVRHVRVREVFAIDQPSLSLLPQPVYGLIFLFQYIDEPPDQHDTPADAGVWFANQTADNACATVALLNIVMNGNEIELGHRLRQFKHTTRDLCSPLRGHLLSSDKFLRSAQNGFARRMDFLNADLWLENESAKSAADAKRKPVRKRARKKVQPDTESGYHFIAYVPSAGSVWELDGMKPHPVCLGPVDPADWTATARLRLEARVLQYDDSQYSFNLLALCKSPLAALSDRIADTVTSHRRLCTRMRHHHDSTLSWLPAGDVGMPLHPDDDAALAPYGLHAGPAPGPDPDPDAPPAPALAIADALGLHRGLRSAQLQAVGDFQTELGSVAEEEERVRGRKRDYMAACHAWVQLLARHDVLEALIAEVDS